MPVIRILTFGQNHQQLNNSINYHLEDSSFQTMKLIIFDCDGVLVDSEALIIDVEMTFLKQHGLNYDKSHYIEQFMGIPVDDWIAKTSVLLTEVKGESLPDDFFNPLDESITNKIDEELQPIAGALNAIRSLDSPKCVASSSSISSLESKLTRTGLIDVFSPHIFSTQLVDHGKPAPDLFLHAANDLNVLPADCVVVEDSANGVTAGKRAGMQVIGFTGGSHCPPGHANSLLAKGADFIATDFSDIITLLG